MRENVIAAIGREKIIAIVRGLKKEECIRTADALYEGGIRAIEVAFDQKCPGSFPETAGQITELVKRYQDRMWIGAGTVLSTELVDLAADAGAQYLIAPDVNEAVIRRTRERNLVSIPGAMSPTEIMKAHEAGADFVKVFPAGNLGVEYIKAVRTPVSHVKFLAVGGVDENNMTEFLNAGMAGVGIGGNLVNKAWIAAGEYGKITGLAKSLCEAAARAI